ncbi:class I SAM-dependent methyltransferase [Anaerosporobacter sp.]|uniref:class I SAM-dependent methyltransferase n=1 Tax=Anaerosporobacter sp. TaxID=1872529 RepID=UPI00286EDAA0|nr:class I SAM-dependent methyltransferase [Anaerosporobacter sp.]
MNEIQSFYEDDCNESQRLLSQAGQIEFFTTMHYLKMYCKPEMNVLDACAGGGIYSFPLADLGCNVTAGDLMTINVEHIRAVDKENMKLKNIYEGSVLDLSQFSDNTFDVVLNLGSYYHLCSEADREKSLSETLRVLKKGGIYMLAYINRCANYMAHFSELKDNFSFLENYMKNGHIDNSNLFYSTTPEMVEQDLEAHNLQLIHNIATDGPIFIYRDTVNQMSEKDFQSFMGIHMDICDKKSNLGYSEHGLLIARKE